MSAEQKRLFERQMETFAGFAEHTDHEVGRLVAQLEAIGELDNTIFFYIVGDNGASAEGGPEGTYNEMMALNGIVGKADQMMDHIEAWGDATTFPHFAIGWAWAGNTPFQWTKQVASHFGGTRNGMVLHWPKGIKAKGEIRSQFHHVIDVAPTVLEAAKLPQPKTVNGVKQRPMDGVSMLYSVDAPKAADRRTTQYFEMFGNRGIYHKGWVACTRHSIPWLMAENPPLSDGCLGTLQRGQGFQPSQQPRRQGTRQAQGTPGTVPEGSRQEQRAAHRRPPRRALQPGHRGQARPVGRTQDADGLPRHDGHAGERLHQREGRAPHHHRRGGAEG